MALAYQIWKDDPRQRPFAERCLQAGKEVYELGRAKEGVQQGNSYGAPYRYEETTWADDMEWGAAELFRATRERRYLEDAKRYAKLAASESWMGQEQTGHYQYYPFMNAGHFRLYDLVDREFKKAAGGLLPRGHRTLRARGREESLSHRRAVHLVLEQPDRRAGHAMPALRADDRRRALPRLHRPTARLAAGPQSVGLHHVYRESAASIPKTRT